MLLITSPFTIIIPIILIYYYRFQRKNNLLKWYFFDDRMELRFESGKLKVVYPFKEIRTWDERKRMGTKSRAFGTEENYTELVFWMNDNRHDGFKETDYSNYAQMSGFFMERLFELGKSEIR
jgi:hypothetical protein